MGYEKKLIEGEIEKILSTGVKGMPQNPASQGYKADQIRQFYYAPEEKILLILQSVENGLLALEKVQLTEEQVNALIETKGYQTKEDLDTAIGGLKLLTEDEVNSLIESKGYQTESQVLIAIGDLPNKVETLEGKVSNLEQNGGGGGGLTEEELVNLGFVKNTDYASEAKYGLVKTFYNKYSSGLEFRNNMLLIYPATKGDIDTKSSTSSLPITPQNLDYAVKVGLTTNTEVLTEEEKTDISAWLGTIKAPAKPSSFNHLLTFNQNGVAGVMKFSTGAKDSNVIPQKEAGGRLRVGNPTTEDHATTKRYVDNLPDYLELTEEQKAKWQDWLGGGEGTWYENLEVFNSQLEPTLVSQTLLSNPKKVKITGVLFAVNITDAKTGETVGEIPTFLDIMYPTVQEVVSKKSGSREDFGFSFYGKVTVGNKTIENIPVTVVCYLGEGTDYEAGQGDGTTRIVLDSYHINWTDGNYIVVDDSGSIASESCTVSLLF